MTVEIMTDAGAVTVKLTGRLDSTTAGDLEAKMEGLITEETTALTMDLTDVDFISSRGLRVLVAAYKQMRGREMILQSPNETILEVLSVSGLLQIFTVK